MEYYQYKGNNIDEFLTKCKGIIDVSDYEEELADARRIRSYQYIDSLEEKILDEFMPYYNLYVWINKTNETINTIDIDSIKIWQDDAIDKINLINEIYRDDKEDLKKIIDDAYHCIYNIIKKEVMLGENAVLSNIRKNGSELDKEKLLSILKEDIKFSTIEETKEYAEKIKKSLEFNNKLISYNVKDLRFYSNWFSCKIMSVLLIPAISTCLGYFIGKGLSNNIDEYKTVTKYNNYTTGKLVSEEEFYDEKSTTSVSSIEIDYPWQEIYNGAKYTRQIEVYDYDDNISKEKLSLDEIIANFKLKYVYTEQKNELSNDDYTDKTVIYVVNTSQDKNDTRKSTKFVIPLSITGGGLGIAIDVILMITGLYDYDYNYLNQKRRKYYQSLIIEKEKIKSNNELIKIADKIVVLKENENTISKGKQNIDDVLSPLVRKR